MSCYQTIACPACGSNEIKNAGQSLNGEPRYRCHNPNCAKKTFMLSYRYKAYRPGVKQQIIDMAINASGIRDTARVLGVAKGTVISTIKKNTKITRG